MTATDPRPWLAAALAARFAPAAGALASAYAEDMSAGPQVPDEDNYDGSEDEYNFGERQYVGKLTTPAFRDWLARQERREAANIAAREAATGGADAGEEVKGWTASCPKRQEPMRHPHADHDET